MDLSLREFLVLRCWSRITDRDYPILTLSDLASDSGIQRPRRYVRSLVKKGLISLCQIFNEDLGLFEGSGYAPTDAGWDLIDSLFAEDELKCQ